MPVEMGMWRIDGDRPVRLSAATLPSEATLEDDGRRYLARSWLARDDEAETGSVAFGKASKGKRAEWNGRDWFVSFGVEGEGRRWEDGRRYGFVSAGGGVWYSRTLREVPVGARVNVCIPQRGYVAIGEVTGPARRFDAALVTIDGVDVSLADQALVGSYADPRARRPPPMTWPSGWCRCAGSRPCRPSRPTGKGMFANQNSACKLRQEFTLDRLAHHFGLNDAEA